MTAGAKTVDRYDFKSFGNARVDLSGEDLNGVTFGYSDFSGAILKGVKFNNGKFARSRFTSANLDGADFSNAKLGGAVMADAGIAFDAAKLTVKLPGEDPTTVDYQKTTIDPAISTSSTTRCPDGDIGPCTGEKLKPRSPFPTIWPWPGRRQWWQESD
jgi:uncharacterized protein YjbI with pentapeptide repeats